MESATFVKFGDHPPPTHRGRLGAELCTAVGAERWWGRPRPPRPALCRVQGQGRQGRQERGHREPLDQSLGEPSQVEGQGEEGAPGWSGALQPSRPPNTRTPGSGGGQGEVGGPGRAAEEPRILPMLGAPEGRSPAPAVRSGGSRGRSCSGRRAPRSAPAPPELRRAEEAPPSARGALRPVPQHRPPGRGDCGSARPASAEATAAGRPCPPPAQPPQGFPHPSWLLQGLEDPLGRSGRRLQPRATARPSAS